MTLPTTSSSYQATCQSSVESTLKSCKICNLPHQALKIPSGPPERFNRSVQIFRHAPAWPDGLQCLPVNCLRDIFKAAGHPYAISNRFVSQGFQGRLCGKLFFHCCKLKKRAPSEDGRCFFPQSGFTPLNHGGLNTLITCFRVDINDYRVNPVIGVLLLVPIHPGVMQGFSHRSLANSIPSPDRNGSGGCNRGEGLQACRHRFPGPLGNIRQDGYHFKVIRIAFKGTESKPFHIWCIIQGNPFVVIRFFHFD